MVHSTSDYQSTLTRLDAEKQRFQALMDLSDDQLRIHNANERVDFKRDELYSGNTPGLTLMLLKRDGTESQYWSAFFTEGYRREAEGIFNKIASFYDNPERARELLQKEFQFSYDAWEYKTQAMYELGEFFEKEKRIHEKRVRCGQAHTIGILENTLDPTPSSPLFGGHSSPPNLDMIERTMR